MECVEDYSELPKSRKEAKESGSMYYFTGKPCKRGHIGKRVTTGGHCRPCEQHKYQTNREAKCAYTRDYKKKNADKVLAYNQMYRANNREKDRQWKRKYEKNNPEKIAAGKKRYREENYEMPSKKASLNYIKNKDKLNARTALWQKNNPAKSRARGQRYNAAKL